MPPSSSDLLLLAVSSWYSMADVACLSLEPLSILHSWLGMGLHGDSYGLVHLPCRRAFFDLARSPTTGPRDGMLPVVWRPDRPTLQNLHPMNGCTCSCKVKLFNHMWLREGMDWRSNSAF